MDWKTEIKQKATDDIGIALENLRGLLPPNSDFFDGCIVFLSRYRKLKKDKFRGTTARETLNIEENKLLEDVLEFVNSVTIDIEAVGKNIENGLVIFYEKIVIYCSDERRSYMEQFFNKHYFRNVHYYDNDFKIFDDADLILFDDKERSDSSKKKLKEILDNNNYVIYFGHPFPLSIKDYGDRAYFANSIFSLYARIKEMLDFLKYINPK